MHGNPAPGAAATSLAWSPAITACAGTAAGRLQGRQQVRRVGLAHRETVAAADRAKQCARPSAASTDRAGASGLLVHTARRQPVLRQRRAARRRHPGTAASSPRHARCNRPSIRPSPPRPAAARARRRRARPAWPRRRPPSRRSRASVNGASPRAAIRRFSAAARSGTEFDQRAIKVEQQGAGSRCCTPKRELKQQDTGRL